MVDTILLCGATGRMGQAIEGLLCATPNHLTMIEKFAKETTEPLPDLLGRATCVVDFSLPESTDQLLSQLIVQKNPIPILIGTTGLNDTHLKKIDAISKFAPILQDTNMSPGIHFLNAVIKNAPQYFDASYDIDLYDRHHHDKIDSPSGTLKTLQSTLETSYNYKDAAYHPTLEENARPANKIGIAVERSGNVFGEHRVSFTSAHEEIQLTHKALDRELFAKGAVLALNWLKKQAPGRYSMANVFK